MCICLFVSFCVNICASLQEGMAWYAALDTRCIPKSLLLPLCPSDPLCHTREAVCPKGSMQSLLELFQGWHEPIADLLRDTDSYETFEGDPRKAIVNVVACRSVPPYRGGWSDRAVLFVLMCDWVGWDGVCVE